MDPIAAPAVAASGSSQAAEEGGAPTDGPAEEPAWRIRPDLAQGALDGAEAEQRQDPDGVEGEGGEGEAEAGAGADGRSEEAVKARFYRQSRHVFVLSSAGKPIYARHGEEDRLATLTPMISAIYDQFDDQGDPIQCIVSGNHRFVFQKREPLYLLGISNNRDPEGLLIQQMQYVYQCIVSLVTDSRLAALKRNLRMDISSHLEPHVITELYDSMDQNPCFLLGGWNCLPIDLDVRKAVTAVIKKHHVADMIYGMMLGENK